MQTSTGVPRRKRRGEYHHGDLRRALIEEAVRAIRRNGVDAVTLRATGERLGVSRTALYRHFPDKAALLTAVATEGFRMLRRELLGAWEQEGDARRRFEDMGRAYVRFALTNPSHYRVMFGGFVHERHDEDLEREGSGAFNALVDALVAQQRDGAVRSDHPQQLALFVWSVVHGVAMLGIDRQVHAPVTPEHLAEYALERVWNGIANESVRSS
jgi:AcrR family transcriptional regulator